MVSSIESLTEIQKYTTRNITTINCMLDLVNNIKDCMNSRSECLARNPNCMLSMIFSFSMKANSHLCIIVSKSLLKFERRDRGR